VTSEGERRIEGRAEDRAGNVRTTSVTVRLDKTPPTGSLTINDGAATTSSTRVTLKIQANDPLSGVAEMRFSNDGRTWSDWEGFQSTRSWDLTRFGGSSSSGLKTVYAQVRDRAGNVSQTFSATIRFTFFTGTLTGHTGDVFPWRSAPTGGCWPPAPAANDDTIKLWEVATGSEVRTLSGHTDWVNSVAFSPDGRLLASGSCDAHDQAVGCGHRQRSAHPHRPHRLCLPWRSAPTGGCWPPAPMTRRSSCGMWPVAASCAPSPATPTSVNSVAFSPDGRLLASGSDDSTIKLWEVATGREVRTLSGHTWVDGPWRSAPTGGCWPPGSRDWTRSSCGMWPQAASCAPSRPHPLCQFRGVQPRRAAAGLRLRGQDDQAVGCGQWQPRAHPLRPHRAGCHSVAFSPDGRLLASGSDDTTIRLWDISDLVGR
jgi:WD40 repeat protein